jgi:hypothetical protein
MQSVKHGLGVAERGEGFEAAKAFYSPTQTGAWNCYSFTSTFLADISREIRKFSFNIVENGVSLVGKDVDKTCAPFLYIFYIYFIKKEKSFNLTGLLFIVSKQFEV